MKKLLLILSIGTGLPAQAGLLHNSITRTLTNGLFYLIASSDASKDTVSHAQELLHHVAPNQELLAVRKFNAFGRFIFGQNNTVAIPYLNYVIVDDALNELPKGASTFALGRCMMMLSDPKKYLAFRYMLPFLGNQLYERLLTKEEKEGPSKLMSSALQLMNNENEYLQREHTTRALFHDKRLSQLAQNAHDDTQKKLKDECRQLTLEVLISHSSWAASTMITNYFARKVEFELDAKTVQTFNCAEGATTYLSNIETSSLGRTLGLFALNWGPSILASIASRLSQQAKEINDNHLVQEAQGYSNIATTLSYLNLLPRYLPGQNNSKNIFSDLSIFIILPYLCRLSKSAPWATERIAALESQSLNNIPEETIHQEPEIAA